MTSTDLVPLLPPALELLTTHLDTQSTHDSESARVGHLPAEVVASIVTARRAGRGWSEMARALDVEGIPTARGGARWYPATVQAVYLAAMRAVEELPSCGACGGSADRLRRLGGVGRALCYRCYQGAKRAAQAAGDDLRVAGLDVTDADLYASLLAKGLAPRSIRLYMQTIWSADRWFDAHGWHLARATPTQVAAYAKTKPMSFATQSGLRIAFGHYWELTQHPVPPIRAIRVPPKPVMVCRALEADAAGRLATEAKARADCKGLAVLLGLYQAMRREEIACTRWDSLDGDWITVIGKGAKTRTIPLHPVVRVALDAHPRTGSPYVFPGRLGDHISPASVWNWVRAVSEDAGIGLVRPHWLRHTALATSNDATKDLRTVQHFAGHARSATTEGYTRASKRRLQEAVMAIDY